ncbi:hypothetical protein M9H77_27679 [Catharanthus roseus]|uniref:Uncharacterized protein n=1 Tax=Catharanthus roseus TaxID=4058 RepID=A0ACC0ADR0_CATRO|nr:hypothetical protein M9H77_27679 [Catharanthus roseus]
MRYIFSVFLAINRMDCPSRFLEILFPMVNAIMQRGKGKGYAIGVPVGPAIVHCALRNYSMQTYKHSSCVVKLRRDSLLILR